MSIHFISGKPGGGKSMYAVKLLVQELRTTKRDIVTNLPIKLLELSEYLNAEYGETFDLQDRLLLLTDEELPNFWLYRGRGRKLETRIEKEIRGRKLTVVDYSACGDWGGVAYFLDEVHIAFNARKWMETGEDCIYYLSQHRKLGDDVVCCTQHVNNVDKQFRSMAQDYTYLRNLSKEKVGIFRSFPLFQRQTYLQPATGVADRPMETAVMRIDVKGLGQVYDTAAGVGIHGRLADTTAKPRGLSLAWLFGVVVLGCVALAFVPKLMGKGASTLISKAVPQPQPVKAQAVVPAIEKTPAGSTVSAIEKAPAVSTVEETREPVYWVGLVPAYPERGFMVFLSNGERYKTVDGEVNLIAKNYVLIGTNRYDWKTMVQSEGPRTVRNERWRR